MKQIISFYDFNISNIEHARRWSICEALERYFDNTAYALFSAYQYYSIIDEQLNSSRPWSRIDILQALKDTPRFDADIVPEELPYKETPWEQIILDNNCWIE